MRRRSASQRDRGQRVALAFARDRAGRLAAAAELDAASRRTRAPFTCPGCGDALVPRLGPVRARHFAHRPGSGCPLTAPETALHFNAKARLLALCAEAWSGRRQVTLVTRCARCRRPDPRDLGALGDGAEAEGRVGERRADVLLTLRGRPALAFEVLVTHEVEAAKAEALAAAGVPMVEVDASAAWEAEGPGGVVEVTCVRALGFEACPSCRALERAELDRARGGEAAQIAELETYRARGLLAQAPASTPRHDAGPRATRRVKSRSSHGNSFPDREYLARRRESGGAGHDAAPDANDAGDDYSRSGAEAPLTQAEVARLGRAFRCPDCGSASLVVGSRLASHPCPIQGARPVAWRGYDGRLARLGWWKR